MEIIGTVVSANENKATVLVKRTSACGENCANCKGACETTKMKSVVENVVGAGVGDVVKIESNSADVVRAAFILYMAPILISIIAAVFSYSFGLSDILTILIFAGCFFLSFFVLKLFEKKIVPKSYITKIIKRA